MTDPNTSSANEPLQFDHAQQAAAQRGGPDGEEKPRIPCSRCSKPIATYYYAIDGETVCASCKQAAERSGVAQRGGGAFVRAGFFGLLAAIVGAVIYYGVIAITNFEIGIVAILTGFLVGLAIRVGAKGGGGRRYQIMAAALTYFSVGMAYTPLAFKGFSEAEKTMADSVAAAVSDSAATDSLAEPDEVVAEQIEEDAAEDSLAAAEENGDPATTKASVANGTGLGLALALGALLLGIFVLPVLSVVASLPSGLISALIIGIGMRQAWQMTAGHVVSITGPFKVGGETPSSAPPAAS